MLRNVSVFLIILNLSVLVSSVTICSSSSLLSTFTDPLCTSWCKVRLCSSGSCRSAMSGGDPTCQCESCTFGSWLGGSSDSNNNQPVTGQYYPPGSGGELAPQNNRDSQYGYNNGNNMRYNDNGYNNNMYNNNGYRGPVTPGYGNSNSNFNSNQQYADPQNYNNGYRNNQYGNSPSSGYGNAGQANYPSGYQNLKRKR